MGDVIPGHFITTLDMNPSRVLQAALDAGLSKVVVLGYDGDDVEYMASSIASGAEVGWLMDRCKHMLLNAYDDDE